MNKAFTKEPTAEPDDAEADDALPAGQKNYMTPTGFAALQDELRHLMREERPKIVEVVSWAAGNGDRSENGDYIYGKKRLREIDRRVRYLTKRLESAIVVDPAQQKNLDQVFFGATVTYLRDSDTPQPWENPGSVMSGCEEPDARRTKDAMKDRPSPSASVRRGAERMKKTDKKTGISAKKKYTEQTVTLVGVDEADFTRGKISWLSPIAQALMKTRVGDTVERRVPAGVTTLEIIAIRYGAP